MMIDPITGRWAGATGAVRGGGSPPDLNDFPPAGEAGGKIINDFINDFPPAGRPAEKIQNFPKLLLLLQQQQPAVRPAFF